MVSDCNNPEKSSVERQHLLVIGTVLPFGDEIGSRLNLFLALVENAFERCQGKLNSFESNISMVHRLWNYSELHNKTLQSSFVGLSSLPPFYKPTTLHCTHTIKITNCLTITTPQCFN